MKQMREETSIDAREAPVALRLMSGAICSMAVPAACYDGCGLFLSVQPSPSVSYRARAYEMLPTTPCALSISRRVHGVLNIADSCHHTDSRRVS